MKVRSIQFKIIITVISAILVISVFIGGFSIYEVDNYVQEHTKEFIDITCSNEAAQTNDIFGDIENSVRIMESYILSLCKSSDDIKDTANQQQILQLVGSMFVDVAANTDGAVAYYLRFDPKISDNKTGIFYTKLDGNDEYVCLEPTDISLYDKNDTEHVGWFWQPYEAGRPIWMAPYNNLNTGILMISFVIPLYFEQQFIGVVGMDFDYTVLTQRIQQIKIFENGFARLEYNGDVISINDEHSNTNSSLELTEEYLQASEELTNGMTLVLFASYNDIRQIRYEIAYKILFSVSLLTVAFSLIVYFVVKKLVKPLKRLTAAAIKLSNGEYDVEIIHSNTHEIKMLNNAFEIMIKNLHERNERQLSLAFRDPLTGLRNTNSYKSWVVSFDQKIKNENISFGIVVLDINYLKKMNDTYGHNVGNKLLSTSSRIISDTFKRSPVFRIGGDEFLVILQGRDLEDRDKLFLDFEAMCENSFIEVEDGKFPVSIAKGFSQFDPSTDTQFSDVFNRADDEMYKNKKAIKMIHMK